MWLKLKDSLLHKAAIPRWLVAETDLPMSLEPMQGSAKRGLTRSTRHTVEVEESQSHLNPERNRCCSHPHCPQGSHALFRVLIPLLAAWKAEGSVWPADVEGILCCEHTGLDMQ